MASAVSLFVFVVVVFFFRRRLGSRTRIVRVAGRGAADLAVWFVVIAMRRLVINVVGLLEIGAWLVELGASVDGVDSE